MFVGLAHKLEALDEWCCFKVKNSFCLRLENGNLYSHNKEVQYKTRADVEGKSKPALID